MTECESPLRDELDFRADADELFELLSDARRRRVLSTLQRADGGAMALTDLADRVAERESDGDDCETVAIALHHVHLPKLAEGGVIDYDPRSETVRYCGRPDRERLLGLADEWGESP